MSVGEDERHDWSSDYSDFFEEPALSPLPKKPARAKVLASAIPERSSTRRAALSKGEQKEKKREIGWNSELYVPSQMQDYTRRSMAVNVLGGAIERRNKLGEFSLSFFLVWMKHLCFLESNSKKKISRKQTESLNGRPARRKKTITNQPILNLSRVRSTVDNKMSRATLACLSSQRRKSKPLSVGSLYFGCLDAL